jgi:hypothetical protein
MSNRFEQGIRITIDGACNTGKTILMQAFAAFLQQHGIAAAQITQLNDTCEAARKDGEEAFQLLDSAVSEGVWESTKFVFLERMVPRHALNENDGDWNAMPDLSNHPIPETPAFSLPRSQIAFEMTNYHVPFSGKLHGHDSSTPLFNKTAHATLTENCRTAAKELGISDQVLDTDCFSTTAVLATKHAPSIESLTSGRPVSDMPGDGKSLGDMFAGRREAKHANDGHSGTVLGHPAKTPRGMTKAIFTLEDPPFIARPERVQAAAQADFKHVAFRKEEQDVSLFVDGIQNGNPLKGNWTIEFWLAGALYEEFADAVKKAREADNQFDQKLSSVSIASSMSANLTKVQNIGQNSLGFVPPGDNQ